MGNNHFNPLSANPTKWSTRVIDHFVKLALKGLIDALS